MISLFFFFFFFFLNDPAPPEISPLPLHAALPISAGDYCRQGAAGAGNRHDPPRRLRRGAAPDPASLSRHRARRLRGLPEPGARGGRSEEHTSELQSQSNLVCRLLLEKKTKT